MRHHQAARKNLQTARVRRALRSAGDWLYPPRRAPFLFVYRGNEFSAEPCSCSRGHAGSCIYVGEGSFAVFVIVIGCAGTLGGHHQCPDGMFGSTFLPKELALYWF